MVKVIVISLHAPPEPPRQLNRSPRYYADKSRSKNRQVGDCYTLVIKDYIVDPVFHKFLLRLSVER